MTAAVREPTAEQIAAIDPLFDIASGLLADEAGVTLTHRQRHILTRICPRPRCRAMVGQHCTTPNGWLANFHQERADLAYNRVKPAKPRKHRLTDAQAQRIEIAAETGRFYAAGQSANFRGDAARRAVADALLRAGLVEEVSADMYGERELKLTAEGWRTYWHHQLVIRRLPDEQHDQTCPCVTASAGTTP